MSARTLSSVAEGLPPSGIRRFFDLVAASQDVISLGVGEPDFTTPEHIREVAVRALRDGMTRYTSNAGIPELRETISGYVRRLHSIEYRPSDEILVTVGVSEGMDLAMRALLSPGDEVLIPEPCFVSYKPMCALAGGKPVPVATRPENDFKLDVGDLEAATSPRTRALVVSYPNNPTGATMSREELLQVAGFAERHDLWVISDEVYERLTYAGEPTCFAALPGMRDRTITLSGFSKAFAMTGWRLGYACGPARVIAVMHRIHQYSMMCCPTLSQIAAVEALNNPRSEEAVQSMKASYDRRRRLIVDGFRALGLDCFEPGGAFYCFPDIRRAGYGDEEFCERLLQEEKVAVVPGTAFGASGAGHVRCCYAVAEQDIREALLRIGRFVERHAAPAAGDRESEPARY
jgi:aminotransferase